jgi:hypothetical protein
MIQGTIFYRERSKESRSSGIFFCSCCRSILREQHNFGVDIQVRTRYSIKITAAVNDLWETGTSLEVISGLPLLITMADHPSSTAAKKSKKKGLKLLRDLIKRPISASVSAIQSNSTRDSLSSAFGAHDLVPGNDAGSTKSTASSKYISSILLLSNLPYRPDPTEPFQSAKYPSSSDPDLLGSAVGQGELQYA